MFDLLDDFIDFVVVGLLDFSCDVAEKRLVLLEIGS